MQRKRQELERQLRVINNRIIQLADVEKIHQQNFDTLGDDVCDLQKHQLEQFVFRFKIVIRFD
jgi:hypothetical protein